MQSLPPKREAFFGHILIVEKQQLIILNKLIFNLKQKQQ
jgi:hypothetical protein